LKGLEDCDEGKRKAHKAVRGLQWTAETGSVARVGGVGKVSMADISHDLSGSRCGAATGTGTGTGSVRVELAVAVSVPGPGPDRSFLTT
jgi:hypothetical protein